MVTIAVESSDEITSQVTFSSGLEAPPCVGDDGPGEVSVSEGCPVGDGVVLDCGGCDGDGDGDVGTVSFGFGSGVVWV